MSHVKTADEWADQFCRELDDLHCRDHPNPVTPVQYALFLRKFFMRIQANAAKIDEKVLSFAYEYGDHLVEIKNIKRQAVHREAELRHRIERLEQELRPYLEHERTAELLVCHQGEESV